MLGTKDKRGYEVWFGFSDEMKEAVALAMAGSTYEVRRSAKRSWGATSRWVEKRPIKWSIKFNPDLWGGCWVLYVSAQAAISEADRRAIRAVRERLQPGTRVRLARAITNLAEAGAKGWVASNGWDNGVDLMLDGISGIHDIGKYWVVPVEDNVR